jgi:hypothetical protein
MDTEPVPGKKGIVGKWDDLVKINQGIHNAQIESGSKIDTRGLPGSVADIADMGADKGTHVTGTKAEEAKKAEG